MSDSMLDILGWGPALAAQFDAVAGAAGGRSLGPGRVIRQERGLLLIQREAGQVLARNAGKMLRGARPEELPTIGDWVALDASGHGHALIHAVLPRRTLLVRRQADSEREAQLIAANVDLVFLVSALDGLVNLRRMERMLAVTLSSGATPVIVLSKADLAEDVEEARAEVEQIASGADVVLLSAEDEAGVQAVRERLRPGVTGVLLGPSGVGKSTLVNRLVGNERLATTEVRAADRKGRHTTTHRELIVLPGGGLLIDGPGIRELGLWGEDTAVDQTFDDVLALAAGCRFSNCQHEEEPGCAVHAAVEEGTLPVDRLIGYLKLREERAFLQREVNPALRRERRNEERKLTKDAWQRSRSKRGE